MKRNNVALALMFCAAVGLTGCGHQMESKDQGHAKAGDEKTSAPTSATTGQENAKLLSPADQDRLVAEAKAAMDSYGGEPDKLATAYANVTRVLEVNPTHNHAHIELARYYLSEGFINFENYRPGTLEKAMNELNKITDDPSGDAFVLLGYILYLSDNVHAAVAMFKSAEKINTVNPWLYQNWALALVKMNDLAAVEGMLHKAEARYTASGPQPRNVLIGLHEKLAGVYTVQHRLDAADKEHQVLLALSPDHAWGHGNYAEFLLYAKGSPDAAIEEAKKALQIMNYGAAHLVLAAAYYAKWAEFQRLKSPKADEYFALATQESTDFSWIMPQAGKSVSAGPAIQNLVRALMKQGVSIDTQDNFGDTGLTLAGYKGDAESTKLLVKYGANIEATNNLGRTAVFTAAISGYPKVIRALAARGAKLNTKDNEELTPLSRAVLAEKPEAVKTLIALKANVNVPGPKGYTTLMCAAFTRNRDIVNLLLKAGADPTARSQEKGGQTAADLAVEKGDPELAFLLREAAAKKR